MNTLIKLLQFQSEYLQDMFFALRFNTYSPFEEKSRRLFYRIIILTHAIEKGLSLVNPRQLFGQEKITTLMGLIRAYDKGFALFPLEMARGALLEYVKVHRESGAQSPLLDEMELFTNDSTYFDGVSPSGGVKLNMAGSKTDKDTALTFLRTRFSCRAFKPEVVSSEVVEQLISAAQWAPSQCNRQSVRVHSYQDKGAIKELLIEQGGSAGMYEGVYNLFVVTSETTAWGGVGQRNQGYVDGALLSHGLLLACHAYGVATCALNLAVGNAKERKIKMMANIHPRERLVMMIAYGYPLENGLKAARSPRLPSSLVLTQH